MLLNKAANTINNRPIGVRFRNGAEPDYAPLTPNLLLLGSRTDDPEEYFDKYDEADTALLRMKMLEVQFRAWWKKWYQEVFDGLVPYPKWKVPKTNLKEGDICLLKFPNKVATAQFRLCRISKCYPDQHGLVRTVDVIVRPRDKREGLLPYKPKQPLTMTVPIQRLVLIHPADPPTTVASNLLHSWPLFETSQSSESSTEDALHIHNSLDLSHGAVLPVEPESLGPLPVVDPDAVHDLNAGDLNVVSDHVP